MNKFIKPSVLPANFSKNEEGGDTKVRADAIRSFKSRSETVAPYSSLLTRYDLTAKDTKEVMEILPTKPVDIG